METSTASTLPVYVVKLFNIDEPGGSYSMLEVTCPRRECGSTFWVRSSWCVIRPVAGASDRPPSRPFGRSCPYCFRAAAIPEDRRVYEEPEEAAPKRHVVKLRRRA